MNSEEMDLDEVIKALAHPVRRDILRWLKEPEAHFVQPDHPFDIGVCAGKFDQATGLSPVSYTHLTLPTTPYV